MSHGWLFVPLLTVELFEHLFDSRECLEPIRKRHAYVEYEQGNMRHLHLHGIFQAYEEVFEIRDDWFSIVESYELFCDANVLKVIVHQMLVNILVICKYYFPRDQLACLLPCH